MREELLKQLIENDLEMEEEDFDNTCNLLEYLQVINNEKIETIVSTYIKYVNQRIKTK